MNQMIWFRSQVGIRNTSHPGIGQFSPLGLANAVYICYLWRSRPDSRVPHKPLAAYLKKNNKNKFVNSLRLGPIELGCSMSTYSGMDHMAEWFHLFPAVKLASEWHLHHRPTALRLSASPRSVYRWPQRRPNHRPVRRAEWRVEISFLMMALTRTKFANLAK